MFGYVRPYREELRVKELDGYQAMYCGLCTTMGDRHGFVARMLLSYDFVFLAMLLAPREERPATCRRRCPARLGLGKKTACAPGEGLSAAADESVILSYWKLRDNVRDNGFLKGLWPRVLSRLLRRGYRRAASAQPAFDGKVRACLEELRRLEEENSSSLDQTADTFARILQGASIPTGDEGRDRALGQLLYHVGRWIYLVDAWDDLEEDRASGGYNPIHARFDGGEEGERDYLRTTLRHSLNLARSAQVLLDLGCWSGTVENILHLGLPAVEELVFRGEWAQVRRLESRRNRV